MLAETGLVGALICVGGILWCLWPSLRRPSADSVFLLGLAMVALIHSQMEYPLWYLTGLATFTVVLACASPEPVAGSVIRPVLRRFSAVFAGSVLMIHVIAGWSSFSTVAAAFSSSPANWSLPLSERINKLQRHPLWAFEAELVMAIHLIPLGEPLGAKRQLLEQQASYRPYGPILFKLAVLRAIQGDLPGAIQATEIMIAGFPGLLLPFLEYANNIPEPAIEPVKKRMMEALAARGVRIETPNQQTSPTSDTSAR
jgi:hypothetical protein